MKKLISFSICLVFTGLLSAEEPNVSFFQALPSKAENPENPSNPAKLKLGEMLYKDKRLSENNTISCNSCHDLNNYGVDNKAKSPGHKGQLGDRNSPTVYNAALHIAQFWDGRAKDVEAQAVGPVMNPKEMAMPAEPEVIKRLSSDAEYVKLFAEAFPGEKEPLSFINMGKAIGAFERSLLTPSRFDDYLNGNKSALTEAEKTGLKTFVDTGCIACHSGALLGAGMYQKLGLVKAYTAANPNDKGRMDLTKNPADEMFFKVPSLRNVEKTAPYFHDGHLATLEEAVKVMAEYQLGRKLSDQQVTEIVTFLKSLTAEKLPAK